MIHFSGHDPKSLILLEYPKILAKLKAFASFSASEALADALRPTSSLEKAQAMQQLTREARYLLSVNNELNFSGAVDMRPLVDMTLRSVTLEAIDLLAIRATLIIHAPPAGSWKTTAQTPRAWRSWRKV
jgi:DNA mismatch repair protein MutS2